MYRLTPEENQLAQEIFKRQMARPGAIEGVVLKYVRSIFAFPLSELPSEKAKNKSSTNAQS